MERVFLVGEKAEAVDSVGCWASCTVKEVRNGEYFVGFDGWTSKWDMPVKHTEIRPVTEQEAIGRTRERKSRGVSSLHLERGDFVMVSVENGRKEAEIITVDPIRNKMEVRIEGQIVTINPSDVDKEEEEEPPVQPQQKRQKVKSVSSKRRHTVDASCSTEPIDRSSPEVRDQVQPQGRGLQDTVDDCFLPCAPAKNSFVSVGDICAFQDILTVVIMTLFMVGEQFYAKCFVCELHSNIVVDFYQGAELKCLTSDLFKVAHKSSGKVSRLIANTVTKQKQCISSSSLKNFSNAEYQQLLRKVRICMQICTDIQSLLSGKSFKRTFEYVLNNFDFIIFGLCVENSFNITFLLEDGFSFLDKLFCARWDVRCCSSDPTSKYSFIRSVQIKASLHALTVVAVKAQSTDTFSDNYREMAVKSLHSIQSGIVVPPSPAPLPGDCNM